MLCPEGTRVQNEITEKDEKADNQKEKQRPSERSGSLELNSFKNPKTWKKSITNFFRNQLRSTRSNDGDKPSGSNHNFEDEEINADQKWQSLGKIFRRQSFAEHSNKSRIQQGETSTQSKKLGVRKVLSTYFGKSQNCNEK